jgi:hypothetical protein
MDACLLIKSGKHEVSACLRNGILKQAQLGISNIHEPKCKIRISKLNYRLKRMPWFAGVSFNKPAIKSIKKQA